MLKRILGWGAGLVVASLLVAGGIAYWRSTSPCEGRVPAHDHPMKAILHCAYGPSEVLRLEEIDRPAPKDDEVLVRVRAASVNPLDWHIMRGTPYVGRFSMGLRNPKDLRFGVDFSGTVEAVGGSVTHFKPGDQVFGGRTGAFGQYVTVREGRAIVQKPANMSFEQAAAVPIAGITALQGLRDQGRLRAGQKVLVNGASGGVGTFAVQIAKQLGAHVTGVCSTRNVELVRSLGADRVIDYTREDFTRLDDRYDLILDNVGNHSLGEYRRALTQDGRYVMVGGQPGRWIDPIPRAVEAALVSLFVHQQMRMFLATLNQKDLDTLRSLMEEGKVTPVIDRHYGLDAVPAAVAYVEQGHARGKVVIDVP